MNINYIVDDCLQVGTGVVLIEYKKGGSYLASVR